MCGIDVTYIYSILSLCALSTGELLETANARLSDAN